MQQRQIEDVGFMQNNVPALAVEGGEPIIRKGFIMRAKWPRIEEDDIQRVLDTLRVGLFTEMTGQDVIREFEIEMAAYCRTRYAMTTNSGTSALHCALAGVGVQSGDEVVVPALTFIACAAAVLHHQAIPVFADVDPYTYNVTPESVKAAITERTRAIMVVHLHGLPADVDGIRAVVEPLGIPIIEDFSQAFGARYRGRAVGGHFTAGAASLMAGKNLPAAGEAGILVTDDREVRNRAAVLKCFGEVIEADGSRRLLHETLGWNYRINLLALAVASQQLFRLDEYNDMRRASAAELDAILSDIPGFVPPVVPEGCHHVYHMYRFRFEPERAGMSITADQAREALKKLFWEEGLPLVEFQNVPLPGHALLQQQVGYGRGCPWTCHKRSDVVYRIEDYPASLDALRHSLIIGFPTQAPLCSRQLVTHYVRCFEKVRDNLGSFESFARGLEATAPWLQPARLF